MADEDKVDEVNKEVEGKKGGNKLFLILFLIIGLGLGGGGAYFFLNQDASQEDADIETVEEEPAEEIEEIELKFVLFEGMAVPVYNSRGKYIGNYKVTIKVLTADDMDNVKVKNVKFELRHAFISRIAEGGLLQPNSTKLDFNKTANELNTIAKSIVGDDVVLGVTVENVVRVNN